MANCHFKFHGKEYCAELSMVGNNSNKVAIFEFINRPYEIEVLKNVYSIYGKFLSLEEGIESFKNFICEGKEGKYKSF